MRFGWLKKKGTKVVIRYFPSPLLSQTSTAQTWTIQKKKSGKFWGKSCVPITLKIENWFNGKLPEYYHSRIIFTTPSCGRFGFFLFELMNALRPIESVGFGDTVDTHDLQSNVDSIDMRKDVDACDGGQGLLDFAVAKHLKSPPTQTELIFVISCANSDSNRPRHYLQAPQDGVVKMIREW